MRTAGSRPWLAAAVLAGLVTWPVAPAAAAQAPACEAGTAGPVAGADGPGGVTLHVVATGTVTWCPAAVINGNLDIPVGDGVSYPLQSPAGPTANVVSDAIDVGHLLTLAGLDPAATTAVQVLRPDDSWVSLTTSDLVDPVTVGSEQLYPVVTFDGSTTEFLRPPRDAADDNAADQVPVTGGAALDLYVYAGPVLSVTASAAPTSVAAGAPVGFAASVAGDTTADGTLTYSWSFGDGTVGSGPDVTHRYAAAGSYAATVTVTGSASPTPGGSSPPVTVTVGNRSVTSGPGHGGGRRKGSGHGPRTGSGRAPGTRPGPGKGSTTPATTTTTTTPPVATTAAAPAATHPRAAGRTARRSAARRVSAPRPVTVTPRPAGAGRLVEGQILTGIVDVTPASLAAAAARAAASTATASAPAVAAGETTDAWGPLAGGGALVALLGAGAGRELRARRRTPGTRRG